MPEAPLRNFRLRSERQVWFDAPLTLLPAAAMAVTRAVAVLVALLICTCAFEADAQTTLSVLPRATAVSAPAPAASAANGLTEGAGLDLTTAARAWLRNATAASPALAQLAQAAARSNLTLAQADVLAFATGFDGFTVASVGAVSVCCDVRRSGTHASRLRRWCSAWPCCSSQIPRSTPQSAGIRSSALRSASLRCSFLSRFRLGELGDCNG